ncbi:MAG: hypothetical protein KUG82_10570 [Pseudomonadales bacterium]|nr:hypothetical protein [Pseudomonadales bacterium]
MQLSKGIILLISLLPIVCVAGPDKNSGMGINDSKGVRFIKNIDNHQISISANLFVNDYDSDNSDYESKGYTLITFYRHYKNVELNSEIKLSHFYEFELGAAYSESKTTSTQSISTPTTITLFDLGKEYRNTLGVGFYYGLEYFIAPEFSIEGKFGARYSKTNSNTDKDSSSLMLPTSSVAVNYYW